MGIKDDVSGKVKEFKGQIREQWGKTTNDPKAVIKGNAEQALGKAQQAAGDFKDKTKASVIDTVDKIKGKTPIVDRSVPNQPRKGY